MKLLILLLLLSGCSGYHSDRYVHPEKHNTPDWYYNPRHYQQPSGYYGELNQYGVPKTVYVQGYFRKDGTYVRPHYRGAPRW